MSDIKRAKELLKRYSSARIPFIVINTMERDKTLEVLKEVADELTISFFVHTMSKGIYDISSGKILSEDKSIYSGIDYMSDQMKRRQNLTLILTGIPDISSENTDAKQLFDLVTHANETGGSIIVFTNGGVWNQLQRLGMTLKIDNPNEEEMYDIIKKYIDDYRNEITIEWEESDIREAASILNGVTRIEAENVIATLIAKREITREDMDEVRFAKDRLFSNISGLEKIDVDESIISVGGLTGLRKWLDEKKELLKVEKKDLLKSKGLRSPRGILLVGVPGCGKSLSAKAISASWKLPLYRLDFATVQGSYVGQSEQQLKDALTTAENVSPCIDVSMLPSELLRRGRFDELFFIDLPTSEERFDIIKMYMRKYLSLDFTGELADKIVEMTEGFTGADLESTVRDLAYRVIANDDFVLDEKNVVQAFTNVVPLSQTSPEKISAIRDWGKERAVPASGKPIGAEEIKTNTESRTRKLLV